MECRWMLFDKNKVYIIHKSRGYSYGRIIHLLVGFCSKMWSSPKHFVPRVALNASHQDAHLLCPEVLRSRQCLTCEKIWLMFLPPAERAIMWQLYTRQNNQVFWEKAKMEEMMSWPGRRLDWKSCLFDAGFTDHHCQEVWLRWKSLCS